MLRAVSRTAPGAPAAPWTWVFSGDGAGRVHRRVRRFTAAAPRPHRRTRASGLPRRISHAHAEGVVHARHDAEDRERASASSFRRAVGAETRTEGRNAPDRSLPEAHTSPSPSYRVNAPNLGPCHSALTLPTRRSSSTASPGSAPQGESRFTIDLPEGSASSRSSEAGLPQVHAKRRHSARSNVAVKCQSYVRRVGGAGLRTSWSGPCRGSAARRGIADLPTLYRLQCASSWLSAQEASDLTRGLLDAAGDVLAMASLDAAASCARAPLFFFFFFFFFFASRSEPN